MNGPCCLCLSAGHCPSLPFFPPSVIEDAIIQRPWRDEGCAAGSGDTSSGSYPIDPSPPGFLPHQRRRWYCSSSGVTRGQHQNGFAFSKEDRHRINNISCTLLRKQTIRYVLPFLLLYFFKGIFVYSSVCRYIYLVS
jgi:hypothetical protein